MKEAIILFLKKIMNKFQNQYDINDEIVLNICKESYIKLNALFIIVFKVTESKTFYKFLIFPQNL